MIEPFNKTTVAQMADRAASEIEQLRMEIDRLAPKAHAYDNLSIVLRLLPQERGGMSLDLAHMLRSRAAELRKPEPAATPASEDDGA